MNKKQNIAVTTLKLIESVARMKANCLCIGRFYEPKVPSKLKK
ncbi:cyclic lactone autoinducer peptide [Pseudobutyrivibrio sp. 49]|nr:cyclic lactone autoinducer peptide [Pseudobutyrivibrio sp. 49]SDI51990.1 cyclic lactone autoinducer peptide [Pseudobutyrivibrio sp. 49]